MSPLTILLEPYHTVIEEGIADYITQYLPKDRLQEAIRYSLSHGGKRLRPSLVLMVAEALGGHHRDVIFPAMAVEFFHTASLIADDLPCMDDDDIRRGAPSLHKAFDEATALLASYSLIAEGYSCLSKGTEALRNSKTPHAINSETIGLLAFEKVSAKTGVMGAAGGQYLDLFASELSPSVVDDIILKKTVSLFEIAFVLGWLFGGGAHSSIPDIEKAAYHLGRAFQIADDLSDSESDLLQGRGANVASVRGRETSYLLLEKELLAMQGIFKMLKLTTTPLMHLCEGLLTHS